MPWLFNHKCNLGQADLSQYSVAKGMREGRKVTVMQCPQCREEVVLEGHEAFTEAVPNSEFNLPPGFVIPTSRRS
jgi:hypothetical protein